MTVRELIVQLANLPERDRDLPVYMNTSPLAPKLRVLSGFKLTHGGKIPRRVRLETYSHMTADEIRKIEGVVP